MTRMGVVLLLAVVAIAGCGGDDDGNEPEEREAQPVEGTFVGKARGGAFVAVVAGPVAKDKQRRDATVFVCDAKKVCEWLSGTASGNDFTAVSEDDDAKGRGTLGAKSARGSIQLGGETIAFVASPAAATSGVYTLTVARNGRLTGASAAGVGLTGRSTLPEPGPGSLKLADGTRIRFSASRDSSGDPIGVPAGEARVIVLPRRQLRGAGTGGGESGGDFFMSSPAR